MLQSQYLYTKLQKKHIDQILSNYNIKYTTMKNEIENKINIMIKTFNQDISEFLNNMEEIASEKQKLKKLERNQIELENTREELKDIIHEQTKLKREIELLKMENVRLKNICNNQSATHTRNNSRRIFSPTFRDSTQKTNNTPSLNQTQQKLKVTKSFFNKAEKKDIQPKRNKSPLNATLRKGHKISGLTLDDKNKTIITRFKRNKDKEKEKELIYNRLNTETKKEPNRNIFKNLKSHQNIFKNNNKDNKGGLFAIKNKIIRKNNNSFNKNAKDKIKNKDNNKLFNKTTRNFNKKVLSKTIIINNTDNTNSNIAAEIKKTENNDYDKENISISDNDNNNDLESKSQASAEYSDEEKLVEDELNEMNEIEDEILSLMGQIKDFEKSHKNVT